MNLINKKYLYANGSSITAGGGFEPIQYRTEVREKYKEKGIDLPETQLECSYPYFLSKKLGLTCINDAKSGSGIDRMIRTTFDWILKNPDKIEHTLFVFEPQIGIRLDWYVKEWKDYGIVNAHLNERGEYPFTLVKDWFSDNIDEQVKWNEKYESSITPYLNNFYDHDVYFRLEYSKLIFFISYLNQTDLDYLLSIPHQIDWDLVQELEKVTPQENQINTILDGLELWQYGQSKSILISDEVEFDDNHLGFFGNQQIAEKISKSLPEVIDINFVCKDEEVWEIEKLFKYTNVRLNNLNEKDIENGTRVDFIPFQYITYNFTPDNNGDISLRKNDHIREQFKNDPNFEIAIKYQQIPILLFFQHEWFNDEQLDILYKILFEELNRSKEKIIIMDCSLTKREGTINPPLFNKLNQFNHLGIYKEQIERNKKFTFLNNKNTVVRFQILDKILKIYDNDVDRLRNENIISFRNFDEELWDSNRNLNINLFKHYIQVSKYYKPHNTAEFYLNIGLPWTFDYFSVGDVRAGMFTPSQYLFSKSFFSVISETWYEYLKLEYEDEKDTPKSIAISEKLFISLSAGTLPFIVHYGQFYVELEKEGLDFSYLKTVFDINYRENNLKQNFDAIDNFVGFLNSKSLQEIESIYSSLQPILSKNMELLVKFENREMTPNIKQFFNEIKSL